MLNLKHMKGNPLFFLLLAPLLWGATPHKESYATHELRTSFKELTYQLNAHQVEIDLLLERLNVLEGKTRQSSTTSPNEGRLAKVEAAQKSLAADLKTLKNHLEKSNDSLHKCQKQLATLDKQLNTDIKSLKGSLQSMIALLKEGGDSNKSYTVSSGDSLGEIACKFKVSTKALKEHNNLSSDTIFPGQKLLIP